ncbi:MAG: VWA domain-containing protein [Candidatus Aegiribacteria sp.]|nr:VWA domain-containing protein [Candidatus Aegiribacteria sp.]
MGFQHPFLLLLLLLAPVYWWLRKKWLNSEMKLLRVFVRPVLWDKVRIHPPPERSFSITLWVTGLILSVIALSGPTWGRSSAIVSTGGKNLVIALDISQSMSSLDEAPSRIVRANAEIRRLIEELDDVRIALVIFSGSSRLASPLTLDRKFLLSRLPDDTWSNTDIVRGTQLGNLVDIMVSALPEMDLEARLGIVFSDGGFHDYATASAIETAKANNMRLLTVGVGGPVEMTIPLENGGILLDTAGDTVRTVLEEESLMKLASETGGVYLPLSQTDDLSSIVQVFLEHISDENSEFASGGSTSTRRYQYFLGAALILFSLAIAVERKGK